MSLFVQIFDWLMVHMGLTWDVWRFCTTAFGEPSVMMVGTTMLQEWHAGKRSSTNSKALVSVL